MARSRNRVRQRLTFTKGRDCKGGLVDSRPNSKLFPVHLEVV